VPHKKLSIQNGWLTNVTKRISTHFNVRPENSCVSLLVIHNISLPPGEFGGGYIEDFFTGTLDTSVHPYFLEIAGLTVSAHCLIDRKGQITQFVSFDERAWHAGRSSFNGEPECNDFGIGVELEGTDETPYTQEQYDSLCVLTETLQHTYPLITCARITGHSDIAPERKTDPGPSFNWSKYFKQLNS